MEVQQCLLVKLGSNDRHLIIIFRFSLPSYLGHNVITESSLKIMREDTKVATRKILSKHNHQGTQDNTTTSNTMPSDTEEIHDHIRCTVKQWKYSANLSMVPRSGLPPLPLFELFSDRASLRLRCTLQKPTHQSVTVSLFPS